MGEVILRVNQPPVENGMSSAPPTKKILILAANPKDTSRLRLDDEVRAIKQRLRLAQGRDGFVVEAEWAVRTGDLQQALFDFAPQMVHFCGHGVGAGGLAFENAVGQAQLVSAAALANLFKLFKAQVECVLLNACYSEQQAMAIAKHIPYVVGMKQAIGDQAAITFADGFYGAVGAGRSIEDAFAFGCNRIQLETIPEHLTPVLKAKRKGKAAVGQLSATSLPIAPTPKSTGGGPLPTTDNPMQAFISDRTKEDPIRVAVTLLGFQWQQYQFPKA
jgi:CHAT domain